MDKHLHIVSFNVPLPANYGGVIDVFYRIKALSEAGVRIHLHCFTYGRTQAEELERYCEEVHYYKRDMSPLRWLDRRPFIVSSRDNRELCQRLDRDSFPILLEGLHCCSLLEDGHLQAGRKVMVRAHNVESEYYSQLADSQRSFFRRIYSRKEARRIMRYEPILKRAAAVFAISEGDRQKLIEMGCREVQLVSGSHPDDHVVSLPGRGSYSFYHGNLEVAENQSAVNFLLENVFNAGQPLVVAGNHPPKWLKSKIDSMENVTLVANPDDAEMRRLTAEAQVIILTTQQATGLKLKLLNSLFVGRHCLVNNAMVQGTGLAGLCHVVDDASQMRETLTQLMASDFTVDEIEQRSIALEPYTTAHAIVPILNYLS